MNERRERLRRLAATLRDHEAVDDAFLAKSFTDRLLIVDVAGGGAVPADVVERLADHDLYGAEQVYGSDSGERSFAGAVGGGTRHHFVDVRTRGTHQSYVVD